MNETPSPVYIAGLDLGQTADPSALAILEKRGEGDAATYDVRHLQRWPLGTSYLKIVADVDGMMRRLPEGAVLAVDHTGVGRAVVDIINARGMPCGVYPVTITGGHTVKESPDGYGVPKKDLVSVMQVLMGTRADGSDAPATEKEPRRLGVAKALPDAAVLLAELQNFRVKVTDSANETFAAWREGDHDDLVLAVAIAAWIGERVFLGVWDATPNPKSRSDVSRAPQGVFLEEESTRPNRYHPNND